MADTAPPDLILDSIRGDGYVLRDWLTSYPLLLVALDPYTHESAWIIETAARVLRHYRPADIRVGFLCAADDDGCRQFLGPFADEFLVFADPERDAVEKLELERLPSLVFIRQDTALHVANGWEPEAWREVCAFLERMLSWSRPIVPQPGDPVPYSGTPALG